MFGINLLSTVKVPIFKNLSLLHYTCVLKKKVISKRFVPNFKLIVFTQLAILFLFVLNVNLPNEQILVSRFMPILCTGWIFPIFNNLHICSYGKHSINPIQFKSNPMWIILPYSTQTLAIIVLTWFWWRKCTFSILFCGNQKIWLFKLLICGTVHLFW
jgi:hypothetical protein